MLVDHGFKGNGALLADIKRLEQAFVNYYKAITGARSDISGLFNMIEDRFMQEQDDTFGKQLGYNVLALVRTPP